MSEVVELRRDCPVVLVPSGRRAVLAAGDQVVVVQRLGGSFTVQIGHGTLVRIDGADADALGIEAETVAGDHGAGEHHAERQGAQSRPGGEHADFRAPDVDEVLNRLRTVYDPEIPVNVVDLGLVELVFEPPWDLGRMSEAARLQLGMW
jgi:hypothetical protein